MNLTSRTQTSPVLVVDLQIGMFDGVAEPALHDAQNLVSRVIQIIAWARAHQQPVAFIRHDGPPGDPLAPEAPGWPILPYLGQIEGEPTFGKTIGDAFSNPDLFAWLQSQRAREIVLVGAQTNFCIAATLNGALESGLDVTVVSDAHSTTDRPDEDASAIILRYNMQFAEAGARVLSTAEFVAQV